MNEKNVSTEKLESWLWSQYFRKRRMDLSGPGKPTVALVGAPDWFIDCLEYGNRSVEVLCLESLGDDLRALDKRQLGQLEFVITSDLVVIFPDPAAYFGSRRIQNEKDEDGNLSGRKKENGFMKKGVEAEDGESSVLQSGDGLQGVMKLNGLQRILSRRYDIATMDITDIEECMSASGRELENLFHLSLLSYHMHMVCFEPYPPNVYPQTAPKELAGCFGFGSNAEFVEERPQQKLAKELEQYQVYKRRLIVPGADEGRKAEIYKFIKDRKHSKLLSAIGKSCSDSIFRHRGMFHYIDANTAEQHRKHNHADDVFSDTDSYMSTFWEDVVNGEARKVNSSKPFWGEMHRWYNSEPESYSIKSKLPLGHFLTSTSLLLHAALLPWPLSSSAICEILAPILELYGISLAPSDKYEKMMGILENESRKLDSSVYLGKSIQLYGYYKTLLQAACDSSAHVLIIGESGTGKEHTARLIHEMSDWKKGAFLAINCASLTTNIAYSELFGHVKGSYTGAENDRAGAIEKANEGTLFLDEIHHLPSESIAHLLRFLQDQSVRRLGTSDDRKFTTRIVAATNNLQFSRNEELRSMGFLQRFKRRVNLPGLNEYVEELEKMVRFFMERAINEVELTEEEKKERMSGWKRFVPLAQWKYRDWTDLNVRELENEVSRITMALNPDWWLPVQPDSEDSKSEEQPCQSEVSEGRGERSRGPVPKIGDEQLLNILREVEKEKDDSDTPETTIRKIAEKTGGQYDKKQSLWNRLSRFKEEGTREEAMSHYRKLFPDRRGRRKK